MIALLRECASFTFSALGMPERIHRRGYADCVSILMYHCVIAERLRVPDWCFLPRDRFVAQMDYLARHFEVLPLDEAIARLSQGRIARPTAVITFDDGFQNNHDVAFPVLSSFGLPFTVYLTTGLVSTQRTVWFCDILDAIGNTTRPSFEWRGEQYGLRTAHTRVEASVRLQRELKSLSQTQLLAEVAQIREQLGCKSEHATGPGSPFRMLDAGSIKRMADSGLAEFGAHTHTHAILSRISPSEGEEEITRSIAEVERITGRPCRHFAYPNGRREDFTPASVALLRELHMKSAVTTTAGPNTQATDYFMLRRYGIGAWTSMSFFKLMVHHALHRG
ncbi:MAG: polysaccharide deacetylase family protein [Thiohalomonadaceae bacterium]